MHHLGFTRSASRRDHFLQTPDTFVRAAFPGLRNATAIIHAAPAIGAAFSQYTLELDNDGRADLDATQSFLYVLQGEVSLAHQGAETGLTAGRYAYLPLGHSSRIVTAAGPARVAVISKDYVPLPGCAPRFFMGDERTVPPAALMGDDAVEVRTLVSSDESLDFAVNTMTFRPGATLPMVEMHVMEHGLLMLQGEGIYRLGDCWYPTSAGDFIWMAPYCPQWFGALGKTPSKYLLYKDWNRHPHQQK
jgi:(S)-ureidoglycine aminohydrolase